MIKLNLGPSFLDPNMIYYLKHILRAQGIMDSGGGGGGGEGGGGETINSANVLNCQSKVALGRKTKLGKRFQMKLENENIQPLSKSSSGTLTFSSRPLV